MSELEEVIRRLVREEVSAALTASAPALPDDSKLGYSYLDAITATGLHRTTLHRAVRSGALKATRHGRRVIFLRSDLEGFLRSKQRPARKSR